MIPDQPHDVLMADVQQTVVDGKLVDQHGYWIRTRDGVTTITCAHCGAESAHPVDVRERYCARCHVFHGDPR